MSVHETALLMVVLDLIMILYTGWVLARSNPTWTTLAGVAGGQVLWLMLLHGGLSQHALFPEDIGGVAFLVVIFAAVGVVGALLFGVPPLRNLVACLRQDQLMAFQGIRVFFGATFLMQASMGVLPPTFGILDGYTHVGAGFLGLLAAYVVAMDATNRRWLWVANAFGLGDILVVASTLALVLLRDIGPHHGMMYAVFLPAPLWLWAHMVSIGKLLTDGDARDGVAEGSVFSH